MEILSIAEYAVLISALDFTGIDEVVFAYGGSASSMYALKEFTFLLLQFSDTTVTHIQVNDYEGTDTTRHDKLEELLECTNQRWDIVSSMEHT